jgi:hypothetical protein
MSDYHAMSLAELKQVAKNHVPKIKQYYIKSKVELIQILTLKDFPEEMIVSKKKISELRKEAQARKLPGIWTLRRSELIQLLYPSTNQNNKDNNNGKEHDHPQKGERHQIRVNVVEDTKQDRP